MRTGEFVAAARSTVVRAVVTVGEVETVYRRVGSGPTVVLVGIDLDEPDLNSTVIAPLAAVCRVIVPDLATMRIVAMMERQGESVFAAWLHGFLEGLGVCGAQVVAPPLLRDELARFSADHPGLVGRVLVVAATRTEPVRTMEATLSWPEVVSQIRGHGD